MNEINIEINTEEIKWEKDFPGAEKIINKAVAAALQETGITAAANIEVSVLLTNNKSIQALNHNYRNKDKATNVLSFPLESFVAGQYEGISGDIAIGDIALALETVIMESDQQNKLAADHLAHLAVHGTLHLLGYDHEQDSEAEVMEALEEKILCQLGIDSPYKFCDNTKQP